MSTLAFHTLLDLHGCDEALLANSDALRPLLLEAVKNAGATIVTDVFHNFSPHGVSGVIVIAESHVAIHTWPERRFAAVDVFSCSPALDQAGLAEAIRAALRAESVESRTLSRG